MGQGDIVVGVDGSAPSLTAARWAAREARRCGRRLRVLHAYQWRPATRLFADDVDQIMEDHVRLLVDRAVDEAKAAAPGVRVSATLVRTAPVVALLDAAEEANLVVVGDRGRGGFAGRWLGSVALQLAAYTPAPVAVIRGDPDRGAGPIVAGVDGSNRARVVLGLALEQAAVRGCAVLATCAYMSPAACPGDVEHELLRSVAEWRAKYPDVPVDHRLAVGHPGEVLAALSGQAQLIVVGGRDRAGLTGRLLGSTSQWLLRHAGCPVLVARA